MNKTISILFICILAFSCTGMDTESYTEFIIENNSDYKVKIEDGSSTIYFSPIEIDSKSKSSMEKASSGKGRDNYLPFDMRTDSIVIIFMSEPEISITYTKDNTSKFNIFMKENYSRQESHSKYMSFYTYTYQITNNDFEEAKKETVDLKLD